MRNKITFSNFYAWLSDDAYLWPDGTYQDGISIDTMRNARFCRIWPAVSNQYQTTGLGTSVTFITDQVNWENYNGSVITTDAGNVYAKGSLVYSVKTYIFSVSGITTAPVLGSTYSNSGSVFFIVGTVLYGSPLSGHIIAIMQSGSWPSSSGSLTHFSGTWDPNINYTSFVTSGGWDGYQCLNSAVFTISGTEFFVFTAVNNLNSNLYPAIVFGMPISSLNSWWNANVVALAVLGNNNTYPTPMLNVYNSILCIGYGNTLFTIDNTWDFVKIYSASTNDSISGFTLFTDQLKVWTNYQNYSGYQLTFDVGQLITDTKSGIVETPQYTLSWNVPIQCATNDWQFDYVIWWTNYFSENLTSFWTSSAYGKQRLHQGAYELGNSKFQFPFGAYATNSMLVRNGIVYINSINGIYAYGSPITGFPASISPLMYTWATKIWALGKNGIIADVGVVCYVDGSGNNQVAYFDFQYTPSNYGYNTSGTIISRIFTGGLVGTVKNTIELNIGYYIPPTTSVNYPHPKIQIYARNAWPGATSYINIWTINDSNPSVIIWQPARYKITASALFNDTYNLREWEVLEIKAVLTWGVTSDASTIVNLTPYLYDITLDYDDWIKP